MRPMKRFGILLKALLFPAKNGNFWIRVPQKFKTKEDKNNFIYSTLEILNLKTEIDDNENSKH
tara:strand:+ start:353 stop:541 length:189 start_codon:yes stop_codon:yes gene_type:complete